MSLAPSQFPDDPNRVGPPADLDGPEFSTLPLAQRLDAAERLCRREVYKEALAEALVEGKLVDSLNRLILDSATSNEDIGQLAREIALDYLDRCAAARGEDIGDFA